jgi:hypothetical protein
MKKQAPTGVSLSDLARQYGLEKQSVKSALEAAGVKWSPGPNRSHLYDEAAARAVLDQKRDVMAEIREQRLATLKADRELREIRLEEKRKGLVPADELLFYVKDITARLRGAITDWPERYRRKAEFDIWRAGIETSKACGLDTSEGEKELAAAERQFAQDLKNGAVPEYFWETVRPENHCRIWSQELNRYYTKAEIIAKFGPHTQISPIDEILAEASELTEPDSVNA